ncbi:MAG: NYN domain-containing protein [Sandaracinobacter sp.]
MANDSPALYRIFFYDCPPLTKKLHYPVSKKPLDMSKTPTAQFRLAVHEELRKTRKVALRLGRLSDLSSWKLSGDATRRLIQAPASFQPMDSDFDIDTKQKGVDMRLGLDVAALAFKQQVRQIILVAADEDFVAAVKLARREGIDVVLDAMGGPAAKDLLFHSDGVRNCRMPSSRPPNRAV